VRPHPWNLGLWQGLIADRARLPHALLLHGPAGLGKRHLALALAKWLLCEAPAADSACGRCAACNWYEQGSHPDFRLVEPEAEGQEADGEAGKKGGRYITIHDIRRLGEFLALAPHQGGWRVVVVQPAETMNAAAANALLKTLEEPPRNVLLILVSHQPRRLLPTVLSRCRKLAIAPPELSTARAWLAGEGVAEADAALLEAGGAPLLARDFAEAERALRREHFLERLAAPSSPALYDLAQEQQHRLAEAWGWLSRWLYDLLAVKALARPRYFPGQALHLQALAARMPLAGLWALQQEISQAGRWLRHPLNSQLLLESWLLRYAQLQEAEHG
jgi:DNA polymerase-3 subunit delta'